MDDTARTGSPPRATTATTVSTAAQEAARGAGSLAARAAESLARGLVTCVFAAVGVLLGAITGGLIGLATETGVVRGTGVGGITGALVSMEVVDSSLAIWRSDDHPAIWSVVYVLGVIWSLLTGRLVREKVDPAVLSAVESQMSAVDSPPEQGAADIFETGGPSGMPRAAIDALPVVRFADTGNNVDDGGDSVACSVCLQEFEAGETARSLPVCRHTFHLPCIDGWLLRHASCPMCRRKV